MRSKWHNVRVLIVALFAGLMALAGCGMTSSNHTYRYRLTVEIETPTGVRSGSSVIEASASESGGLNGSMVHSELRGEAVSIVMPDGGTLFALLQSVDGLSGAYASAAYAVILPDSINKNADWRVPHDAIAHQTSVAEVPVSHYPIFVRFADINNPASVVIVDPARLDRDYGPGVRLKRVYVQTTDDSVTTGIEKKLVWLKHIGSLSSSNGIHRGRYNSRRNLSRGAFSQGVF